MPKPWQEVLSRRGCRQDWISLCKVGCQCARACVRACVKQQAPICSVARWPKDQAHSRRWNQSFVSQGGLVSVSELLIESTNAADLRAEQMSFLETLFEIHTPPRTPDQCDSLLTKTPIKKSLAESLRDFFVLQPFPPRCLFSLWYLGSSSSLLFNAANWKRRVHWQHSNEARTELLAPECYFLVFPKKQTWLELCRLQLD